MPQAFSWEAMGCQWSVTIWDELPTTQFQAIQTAIVDECRMFDETFSRFKKTSALAQLGGKIGRYSVPPVFNEILSLYETFYGATGGRYTPLIGGLLSDLGYDSKYSLTPKADIRAVPRLESAVTRLDPVTIEIHEPVHFDFGALGKGFFVDRIHDLLDAQGIQRYLVNGSGDVYYRSSMEPVWAGLENPRDATQVIGRILIQNESLCGSAGSRRRWDKYHHIVDPLTTTSPEEILASWVKAERTVIADGIATALFLVPPEDLASQFSFEYCLLNPEYRIKKSPGFTAELFS